MIKIIQILLAIIVFGNVTQSYAQLRNNCDDTVVVKKTVDVIDTYLIKNLALRLFLNALNASLDAPYRLSEHEIVTILKNSALLVSIKTVLSLGEVVHAIQETSHALLSGPRLHQLLKSLSIDEDKTVLELWEKKNFLTQLYVLQEFKAIEQDTKKKYANKVKCIQRNFKNIISALGITDAYADELKRLTLMSGQNEKRLYELFDSAYSGETETLSLETYVMSVVKNRRQCCFYKK